MPFASYKGYGLALICELFAGVLSGGGTCRPETNRENDTILNNMLSVIIDPTRMVGQDFFDNEAAATLSHVKASPPMNSDEPVLVPGDPERATGKQRRADGIPVDEQSWHCSPTPPWRSGSPRSGSRRLPGLTRQRNGSVHPESTGPNRVGASFKVWGVERLPVDLRKPPRPAPPSTHRDHGQEPVSPRGADPMSVPSARTARKGRDSCPRG
ncbi:MAG: hypothetical protein Ct9H300mP16_00120 [Pseudomonadota bacterium]|nr:MAG: hypothetical protein Ct9H300mP16_00120 [Pseudomonadota bacterium]